jgi:hypothetical protein
MKGQKVMDQLSRRSLAKALVSLPFALALNSQSRAFASVFNQERFEAAELRFVLHGAYAIVLDDHGIQIYAPTIREHSYKIGCWGQEVRQEEGSVFQWDPSIGETVSPVYKSLEEDTNAVLYKKTLRPEPVKKCFFSLSAPLPTEIRSLRRLKKKDGSFFDGNDAVQINGKLKSFALIHVLIFRFKQDFSPTQNSPAWGKVDKGKIVNSVAPATGSSNGIQVQTWHFFAEPDTEVPETSGAFDAVTGLFDSVELKVHNSNLSNKSDITTGLSGFHGWEEQTLLERSKLRHHSPCLQEKLTGSNPVNCGKLFVDNRT